MNNIGIYVAFGFMAIIGGGSTLYCVSALIVMILYKFYRKIRYGASLYD
ncbi:MAG: hypothetical protein K6F31_09350 [Acetatifactor sp.]|nr:hypothetical protein [Acetatifactor sp.]